MRLTPALKVSINGAENNAGIVWEDGDAGDPSAQAAGTTVGCSF